MITAGGFNKTNKFKHKAIYYEKIPLVTPRYIAVLNFLCYKQLFKQRYKQV